MRKTLHGLVALFVVGALTYSTAQSNIEGQWVTTDFNRGVQIPIVLNVQGSTVSGTISGAGGGGRATPIENGRIDGDTVTFTTSIADGGRVITFRGKVSGEEIAFTRSVAVRDATQNQGLGIFGALGRTEFVARRNATAPTVPTTPSARPLPSVAPASTGLIADNSRARVMPRSSQTGAREPLRVLFIGSSATRSNNLPDMVGAIAASKVDGPAIEASSITLPGSTLRSHIVEGTVIRALAERWEFVVMEEDYYLRETLDRTPPPVPTGSVRPSLGPPTTYQTSVRDLSARVRAQGGTPILWTRWQFEGYPDLQNDLDRAVLDIGGELNIPVASVSAAMVEAWHVPGRPALFATDGHPAAAGSYLAALVIYGTLTGEDPRGALGTIPPLLDLSSAATRLLQEVAWSVLQRQGKAPR